MALLSPNPKLQFFDSNGDPLVDGKLYTYAAGTNTPLATYTDATGGTPNANPVELDSRGEATVFLGTAQYKFVLKDSDDNTIWTVDNFGGIVTQTQIDAITTQIADVYTDFAAPDGSSLVGYNQGDVNASDRTVESKLQELPSVKDFGAVGDGVTDDTTAFNNSQTAGIGPIYIPPGVYIVTGEIIVKEGCGFIGANAFWKRRTGYVYDGTKNSVIKYTGAGGTNSCVVRASEKAVGVQGSDFSGPETDDLNNIKLENFHVDANNLAEIGVYVYRAGNQSNIGNITAEKAKKYNHVHLGCYAAKFGTFGSYECEEHGAAIGWDIFTWNTVESTCFAYTASFLLANNGTAGTYVAGGAFDLDGSGGKFRVGRGSTVHITSENNDGRACILSQYNSANATMGTTDYVLEYLEGNGDGPYIDYRDAMDSIRLMNGFLHPGDGGSLLPQNITIDGKNNSGVTTTDSGPTKQEEWLTLYRLHGDLSGVGVEIDSNTYKYRIIECTPYFTFATKKPGAAPFNLTLEGASTAGTQTYTLRSGYYTRYANIVHVTGRITLSALDGATAGQIRISGLPFPISNQSNLFGSVSIGAWNALTTSVIGIYGTLTGNTSYIALNKLTAAATNNLTTLVPADLSNTTLLQFSATYITDAS